MRKILCLLLVLSSAMLGACCENAEPDIWVFYSFYTDDPRAPSNGRMEALACFSDIGSPQVLKNHLMWMSRDWHPTSHIVIDQIVRVK